MEIVEPPVAKTLPPAASAVATPVQGQCALANQPLSIILTVKGPAMVSVIFTSVLNFVLAGQRDPFLPIENKFLFVLTGGYQDRTPG